MNQTWQQLLQRGDARIHADSLADFGNPAAELAAAENGTVLIPILERGVIRVSGEESAAFLQNLLTNDVKQLAADGAQHNGLCSPKGRLFATFLVWRDGVDYLLQTERELLPALQKKLSMYVLRAKVKISDVSDETLLLGIAGAGAVAALTQSNITAPERLMTTVNFPQGHVIRIDAQRYQLAVKAEAVGEVWQALRAHAQAASGAVWRWLEITAGIPRISAATQEQFVPQMVNFELIGGVNFKKGCYPGQEIVARTQYLGKLKRRMYLAHLNSEAMPVAGAPLYAPDLPDQACGMVVDAAAAPGGGYDLLAVVQMSNVEAGKVHAGEPNGAQLEFRPLPYAVS